MPFFTDGENYRLNFWGNYAWHEMLEVLDKAFMAEGKELNVTELIEIMRDRSIGRSRMALTQAAQRMADLGLLTKRKEGSEVFCAITEYGHHMSSVWAIIKKIDKRQGGEIKPPEKHKPDKELRMNLNR